MTLSREERQTTPGTKGRHTAFEGCSRQNGEKKTEDFSERMEQPLTRPSIVVISHDYIGCHDVDGFFYTYCCKPAE